jgi:hypothetical protein
VPTFVDRGCHVVSVTDPYGGILGVSRPATENLNLTQCSPSSCHSLLGFQTFSDAKRRMTGEILIELDL